MNPGGPFRDKLSVRVEALALTRGARLLFENLSFALAAGGYFEIRGANGSGKTSLLRALAGWLRPSAGKIAIEGVEEPATALHYVGHLNGLKGQASARAHVRYWAALLGGGVDADAVLTSLRLLLVADLPARQLSQGQARRLALARLLVAPRPVWLLDEPAAGLDARARAELSEMVDAHRAGGGLVLAAVHDALGPAPTQTLELA